jgi:uncharacterized protein involved in exopolysaccharide biosynthesis
MTEMQDTAQGANNAAQVNPAEDDEISLLDLAQTVVDNLRLLVLGPLAAGVLALGVSFVVTPTFTAKVTFMPPQQQQSAAASMLSSLGSLAGLAGAATGIKNPNDQYLAFLKTASLQDELIKKFDLKTRYDAKLQMDARLALTGNVKAAAGKDGMITVEVDDKDPKFAADLANAHVSELHALLGRLAVTEAQQRRKFFEEQLQLTKTRLAKAQSDLMSSGISVQLLKGNPSSAISAIATLQAQVTSQEVKLGAMRGYLTEQAPEYKKELSDLLNLRAQLARLQKADPETGADKAGAEQSGRPNYNEVYREFKYQESLLELFTKQFEAAKLDESREGAVIQVVDAAQPPERKSKPKKALIAIIATLASGFALLLFVFVRQALRNGSQDEETARKLAAIHAGWKRAIGKA